MATKKPKDVEVPNYKTEQTDFYYQTPKNAAEAMQEQINIQNRNKKKALLEEQSKEIPKPVKPTAPEVFRDAETGKVSGVTLPNGKSFIGINQRDVEGLVSGYQQNTTDPTGTLPAGTAQAGVDRQLRLQQLIQLGEQGLLSPQELQTLQQAPIDMGQAATSGLMGALPGLAGVGAGLALSATGVGAVAGVPIATISALSIAGTITGILLGVKSNIAKQQKGEIAKTKDVLTAAKTNMRALAMIAAKDPSKADEAIISYYEQKAQVQKAQRQLQLETQGNLNKFMEDGTEDLSDFELFLQPGGYADLQLLRLQQATASGQPASDEELLMLAQEVNDNE